MKTPIQKYLNTYAEPESAFVADLQGAWSRVLVVPICDEEALFFPFLSSAQKAARHLCEKLNQRPLFVFVFNSRVDAEQKVHQANHHVMEKLAASCRATQAAHPNFFFGEGALGEIAEADILVVDRTSEGKRFSKKQGVGLARKIGADIALRLFSKNQISSPWIFSTDADVELPLDYFDVAPQKENTSALIFPFKHILKEKDPCSQATALYEKYLHSYVDGLAFAGSPYAFHTLGSTLVVHVSSYAQVRGFPKLQAGEDFHFLRKLFKVGNIHSMHREPIKVQSRISNRIPFGTGPSVQKILEEGEANFKKHDPTVYQALRVWLEQINRFSLGQNVRFSGEHKVFLDNEWQAWQPRFNQAFSNCKTARQKQKQAHRLFDSLRTLQFIHKFESNLLHK